MAIFYLAKACVRVAYCELVQTLLCACVVSGLSYLAAVLLNKLEWGWIMVVDVGQYMLQNVAREYIYQHLGNVVFDKLHRFVLIDLAYTDHAKFDKFITEKRQRLFALIDSTISIMSSGAQVIPSMCWIVASICRPEVSANITLPWIILVNGAGVYITYVLTNKSGAIAASHVDARERLGCMAGLTGTSFIGKHQRYSEDFVASVDRMSNIDTQYRTLGNKSRVYAPFISNISVLTGFACAMIIYAATDDMKLSCSLWQQFYGLSESIGSVLKNAGDMYAKHADAIKDFDDLHTEIDTSPDWQSPHPAYDITLTFVAPSKKFAIRNKRCTIRTGLNRLCGGTGSGKSMTISALTNDVDLSEKLPDGSPVVTEYKFAAVGVADPEMGIPAEVRGETSPASICMAKNTICLKQDDIVVGRIPVPAREIYHEILVGGRAPLDTASASADELYLLQLAREFGKQDLLPNLDVMLSMNASGGQKRVLATFMSIMRMRKSRAPILILDEMDAGCDPSLVQRMLAYLRREIASGFLRGKIVIIVAHTLSALENCNDITYT